MVGLKKINKDEMRVLDVAGIAIELFQGCRQSFKVEVLQVMKINSFGVQALAKIFKME